MKNNDDFFKNLWQAHFDWSIGTIFSQSESVPTANMYFSEVSGAYYNFAVPKVLTPKELDLSGIEAALKSNEKKPSFYLFSTHQEAGFVEFLIRKGYKSIGGDCWMAVDPENYINPEPTARVEEVTLDNFVDYYSVLSHVFSDFPGNVKYLEICHKTLKGEIKSKFDDLVSKLFIIYDNGEPAAGAGLFYSKKANTAYLHDAGTLEEFRGKGYQTSLLKHRANIALKENITRIYSSVEPYGQSWHNCIKAGFKQTPWSIYLSK